jgi:hypothetical protein
MNFFTVTLAYTVRYRGEALSFNFRTRKNISRYPNSMTNKIPRSTHFEWSSLIPKRFVMMYSPVSFLSPGHKGSNSSPIKSFL